MSKRNGQWLLGLGAAVLVAAGGVAGWRAMAAAKGPLEPDAMASQIAVSFDRVMPRMHLTHEPVDEYVATNALDIYLTMLDFDRSFFMATDVAAFRQEAQLLPERVRKGDVSFAFRVFERFKERVRNRVDYADRLLGKGFDLNVKESYMWKRKDTPWPADEDAWDELWRKKVKNEYVARVVSQRLAAEERTNAVAGASSTNAAPVAREAAATNAPASVPDPLVDPAEFVRRRYKQYLMVLEDSDADFVLQRYFTAFAQAYDPHSEYMTASSSEDFDISMKLSLFGIGALLTTEDGAAKVERLIPGGPAERDGRLKPGDKIVAVAQGDGEAVDVLHWPLYKTVRLIRGEKGTKVVLTVIPAADISGSRTVKIDIKRDEVKLEEQAAKGDVLEVTDEQGVTNKIGVVRLPAFYADMKSRKNGSSESRSSTRDVAEIIAGMKGKGVRGILLDLRNNGGGSLAEAVDMTGLFIPVGPVVQVREDRGVQVLRDMDPDVLYAGPMVVLVNRHSASASEILTGALQDYGRAVIVGDSKTHGKGTVQSLQNLDPRNARLGSLKVTTHSFYRVAGGSTQKKGVIPDIIVSSLWDAMEVGEEYLPRALEWTVISMARYAPVADLSTVIPVLKQRSEARRQKDARFAALKNTIARLKKNQESTEVPLQLDDRIALAKEEKGLARMQEEAAEADGGDEGSEVKTPDKSRDGDIILTEAGRILVDLANRTGEKEKRDGNTVLEDARGGK